MKFIKLTLDNENRTQVNVAVEHISAIAEINLSYPTVFNPRAKVWTDSNPEPFIVSETVEEIIKLLQEVE